jgi:predicted acylesterase/phospholipase RssA
LKIAASKKSIESLARNARLYNFAGGRCAMNGQNADAGDLANPKGECDLIMKGGLTSGVVFPKALTTLARNYRFKAIGGTSAGAIAAVMAAAAEYRRQMAETEADKKAGFEKIDELPAILGRDLKTLFQPSPRLSPLFQIGLAALDAKQKTLTAVLLATMKVFALPIGLSLLPGLIIALLSVFYCSVPGFILGVVLAVICMALTIAVLLYRLVFKTLPAEDFGICPGKTMDGNGDKHAFTDWMHFHIQDIAGLDPKGPPLTIGQLNAVGVELASVTTDLSSGRPYQLPIKSNNRFFSRAEFAELFSPDLLEHIIKSTTKEPVGARNGKDDLYRMPRWDEWPVVLVARMSLSFPILIRPVPLYRDDFTLKRRDIPKGPHLRLRCLLSDGGISSNFPIHFFDGLIPSRPTFGISLASYDKDRYPFNERVLLPEETGDNKAAPIHTISSLPDFLMTIVNTAKDWQDTLQSQLHGYKERVVEIRLDDSKEGGLNLNMDSETVGALARYGEDAGKKIISSFDFDEHRWRRSVTSLFKLSQHLVTFAERYEKMDYAAILEKHPASGFTRIADSNTIRARYGALARELVAIGDRLNGEALPAPSKEITNLRITPSIDTNPPPTPPPPAQ